MKLLHGRFHLLNREETSLYLLTSAEELKYLCVYTYTFKAEGWVVTVLNKIKKGFVGIGGPIGLYDLEQCKRRWRHVTFLPFNRVHSKVYLLDFGRNRFETIISSMNFSPGGNYEHSVLLAGRHGLSESDNYTVRSLPTMETLERYSHIE